MRGSKKLRRFLHAGFYNRQRLHFFAGIYPEKLKQHRYLNLSNSASTFWGELLELNMVNFYRTIMVGLSQLS